MLKWVLDRAKERSTWIGLASVLAAAGVALSPELKEAIIATGIAVAGLVAVITKD